MEEVQAERNLVCDPFAAVLPLENVFAVLIDTLQGVPEVSIVHEVHHQYRIALSKNTDTHVIC